jgi:hypothetical protein
VPKRRLNVILKRDEAITVDKISLDNHKLAYVICADRKLRYNGGRSRIAYIGTTVNGIDRFAQSAAYHSDTIFDLGRIYRFRVFVVTCTTRQHVDTWKRLERALLITFKEMYGEIPNGNTHGKHFKWTATDERYFRKARLRTVVEDLS